MVDKNASVPIACPKCGTKFHKTIGWIESNKEFSCDNDDCEVVFNAEDFVQDLNNAEKKAIKDLQKSIKDIKLDL